MGRAGWYTCRGCRVSAVWCTAVVGLLAWSRAESAVLAVVDCLGRHSLDSAGVRVGCVAARRGCIQRARMVTQHEKHKKPPPPDR